jgi:hypothetical protein
MQKTSGVKTMSIIDTLSELVQQDGGIGGGGVTNVELHHRLITPPSATPSHGPYYHYPLNTPPRRPPSDTPSNRRAAPPPPSLQPRSPKVFNIVPSPPKVRHRSHVTATAVAGSNGPLATSSTANLASPLVKQAINLSAINSPLNQSSASLLNGTKSKQQQVVVTPLSSSSSKHLKNGGNAVPSSSRGQTPDWIREIFINTKRGIIDKLVRKLYMTGIPEMWLLHNVLKFSVG